MSELHNHKIKLSDGQKKKLLTAYRRRRSVALGLSRDQLNGYGGDDVMLNLQQHQNVVKAKKANKGLRLELSYDQLLKNKQGGLLKEVLNLIESDVPGGKRFISPVVRHALAPLLKNKFVPWLKNLIDNELDSVIGPKGSGLKRCINRKLDQLLGNKKKSHLYRSQILRGSSKR